MPIQKTRPDRRGMGAQSDFIAQPFIPSELYKSQQQAMRANLIASGATPDQLVSLFLLPTENLTQQPADEPLAPPTRAIPGQENTPLITT